MELSRRTFLAGSAAGLVALSARRAAADANSTVVLALMGANNRGSQLATGFAKLKGVEFAYVCDPDERAIAKGIEAATSGGGRRAARTERFSQSARRSGSRRAGVCRAQSLACGGHDSGLRGRQARVCREALQPDTR